MRTADEVSGSPRRLAPPRNRVCASHPDGHRPGRVRRRAAGRDRRGSSPALIEKTRTAVTDGTGQYRIIDLRPGTYSLTFTLPGFNTVKRESIELTGSSDADDPDRDEGRRRSRKRSPSPARRRSSTCRARKREIVMQRRRHPDAPGDARRRRAAQRHARASTSDTNGRGAVADDDARSTRARARSTRARSAAKAAMPINGFPVTAARSGGFASVRLRHGQRARKSAITVGGGLGESDIGGPVMNIVPKSGGNSVRGQRVLQHRRRVVERQQPDQRAPGAQPEPEADAGHHQRLRLERVARRPDHQGPAVVLRQLPQSRHADGAGRHRRQRECRRRRRAGTGSAIADRRAPRAGPADDHRPPHRPVRQEPRPLQLRVPAPLRGHAAHGRRRRAATTAATTGSASATTRRRTQMSPEATSTAAAATSTCRSTSTRAPGRCRRPTSCCSRPAISRSATSRSSATRRRTASPT